MSGTPGVIVLDLPSVPASTVPVRAAVRGLADAGDRLRLTTSDLEEVAVAVNEACTNVIRHASSDGGEHSFRIELRVGDDALEVCLSNEGPEYELGDGEMPDPELLLEGGYGLPIICEWMDDVQLTHDDGHNVLRMVRHYRSETEGAHA